jgi:putative peptidoglycan lipid II flippase
MGLINMLLLMAILRRKINGIRGNAIMKSFLKTLAASLVMGVAVFVTAKIFGILSNRLGLGSHGEAAIIVAAGITIGVAVFFITAWFLKMDELTMSIRLIKGKLLKR